MLGYFKIINQEIKAVKMNAKVVNSFVACFNKSVTLMKIIAYAQDSGCRVGRAWKSKARLFQKFSPDDSINSLNPHTIIRFTRTHYI